MSLNPSTQYLTDSNLRARQRLWEGQDPPFDLISWVLDVAGVGAVAGQRVLDVGCGNGRYLHELRSRGVDAVGIDLSVGMLGAAAPHAQLSNADVTALPFVSSSFDVVLAPHMLYHVDDRPAAAREMRRVLEPNGRCVVVTNGANHLRSLRELIEAAVREVTPEWEMRNPSTHLFSLENGAEPLGAAFDRIVCVRPEGNAPVRLTDAEIAAGYVASVADHYEHETTRPWGAVVQEVRRAVEDRIEQDGAFVVASDVGAFICD